MPGGDPLSSRLDGSIEVLTHSSRGVQASTRSGTKLAVQRRRAPMYRIPFLSRLAVGAIFAVVSLACGSQTSTNNTSTENQPGVTKDQITIGATFPASGPASAYYSVAKGADAYFEYVNAHGGVAGGRRETNNRPR